MNKEVAIAGIGTTGFGQFSGRSATSMASQALQAALDDAGLDRSDVDGLTSHIGSPRGLDCDELARLLALDVRFVSQTWDHGRFCATVIETGAMALMNDLAEVVVCIAVFRNSAFTRHGTEGFPGFEENFREGGGPHAESPHTGLLAPIGGAAMSTRRYFYKNNVAPDALAADCPCLSQARRAQSTRCQARAADPGHISGHPVYLRTIATTGLLCSR